MAQQQPYIYNRGQQIRQDLGAAADSVAEGFQNLLNKKKQEYDFVNKTYEDIELIKKDLNIYNNELITKKSGELLQETASSIKEKGKLDFSKLGEVKNKVRELADAKRNSELSIKAADEVIKLMQQNAPNMRDPIGTYSKIVASLKDEKNLFSPKNMYESAMTTYKDGIDYVKVGQNKLQELIKNGNPISTSYINKRGDLIEVKGVIPQGFKFDSTENRVVPDIRKDEATGNTINPSEVIARNLFTPEQLEGYKKQIMGAGVMFDSDPINYISNFVNSSFSNAVTEKINTTAESLRKTEAQAMKAEEDIKTAKFENSDAYRNLKIKGMESDIASNITRADAAVMSASASSQNAATNAAELEEKRKSGYFTKEQSVKSGAPRTSTPNSFIADTKFRNKKIVSTENNTHRGVTLTDEYGSKIWLDTQPKIDDYRNNISEADRKLLDEITSSPSYKPPKGGGKAITTPKFDPNNPL